MVARMTNDDAELVRELLECAKQEFRMLRAEELVIFARCERALRRAADAIERLSGTDVVINGVLRFHNENYRTTISFHPTSNNCVAINDGQIILTAANAMALRDWLIDRYGERLSASSVSEAGGEDVTPAMIEAGCNAVFGLLVDEYTAIYRAMRAAAPVSDEAKHLAKWAREAADDLNWIFAGEPPPDRAKLLIYTANLRALADIADPPLTKVP